MNKAGGENWKKGVRLENYGTQPTLAKFLINSKTNF